VYHQKMSNVQSEFVDFGSADRSVSADVLLREQPDEEEDEDDDDEEEDQEDGNTDGYSE
jgi:hypothetical protein